MLDITQKWTTRQALELNTRRFCVLHKLYIVEGGRYSGWRLRHRGCRRSRGEDLGWQQALIANLLQVCVCQHTLPSLSVHLCKHNRHDSSDKPHRFLHHNSNKASFKLSYIPQQKNVRSNCFQMRKWCHVMLLHYKHIIYVSEGIFVFMDATFDWWL